MTFADFVEVEKIEKVIMSNNSRKFILSTEQLSEFKKQISSLTYEPNISAKLGTIHMTLIIDNKQYNISTATHGDFAEIDYDLITKNKSEFDNVFFKTNGINFDNYKKTK